MSQDKPVPFESMPINVTFRKGVRTDGEVESATITQGTNELRLTEQQLVALARQINVRYTVQP